MYVHYKLLVGDKIQIQIGVLRPTEESLEQSIDKKIFGNLCCKLCVCVCVSKCDYNLWIYVYCIHLLNLTRLRALSYNWSKY